MGINEIIEIAESYDEVFSQSFTYKTNKNTIWIRFEGLELTIYFWLKK